MLSYHSNEERRSFLFRPGIHKMLWLIPITVTKFNASSSVFFHHTKVSVGEKTLSFFFLNNLNISQPFINIIMISNGIIIYNVTNYTIKRSVPQYDCQSDILSLYMSINVISSHRFVHYSQMIIVLVSIQIMILDTHLLALVLLFWHLLHFVIILFIYILLIFLIYILITIFKFKYI